MLDLPLPERESAPLHDPVPAAEVPTTKTGVTTSGSNGGPGVVAGGDGEVVGTSVVSEGVEFIDLDTILPHVSQARAVEYINNTGFPLVNSIA